MRSRAANDVLLQRWFTALLLAALLLTNRYLSLETDAQQVRFVGGDSYAYLAIAQAFPGLPQDTLPRHHAQRLAIPYVLGGAAWVLGVPAEDVFRPFVLLAVLGVVLLVHRILGHLAMPLEMRMILLSLLILNTYVFRYHLAVPWMVSDVGFQLGVGMVLLGLLGQRPGLTLAGLLTASVSKQTGLALIPGAIAWIWLEWTAPRRVKIALCVGVALLGAVVYQATSALAAPFSGRSIVALHVTGLVRWLGTRFSLPVLAGFAARGLVGFVLPAALFLSLAVTRALAPGWYRDRRFLLCLVLTVSIGAQPVVAGPAATAESMTRLIMLGYVPLLVGLGSLLARTALTAVVRRRLLVVSVLSTAIASFHHFYSFLGVPDMSRAGRFLSVYLGAALLLFVGSIVAQRLGPDTD